MKYTVYQINLTDEQSDEVNRESRNSGEYPAFYKRYLDTTVFASAKTVNVAWDAGDYAPACRIEAGSLDDVFEIGNIGPEKRIERLCVMHSVSVGDVIEDPHGNRHIVADIGFDELQGSTA